MDDNKTMLEIEKLESKLDTSSVKEIEEMIKKFQDDIEKNSNNYRAYINLGLIYGKKSEYNKALTFFEKAININPEDAIDNGVMDMFTDLCTITGKYDKTIYLWKSLLQEKVYSNKALIYFNIGVMYSLKKDYKKSIENYNMAIDLNPQYDKAYYNMGYDYHSQGKRDKALDCYSKALAINPNDDMIYNEIGAIFMWQKMYQSALMQFEQALDINPYNQSAHNNIAKINSLQNSSCFIATSVYNSPTASKVMILKEFRDQKLLTNSLGKQFIQFYYKKSPPIADFLSRYSLPRELVRVLFVEPLVWVVKKLT